MIVLNDGLKGNMERENESDALFTRLLKMTNIKAPSLKI